MSVKPEAYPPSNPRGFGITSCSNCGQPVDLVDVPQAITGHTFTRDEIATAMTSHGSDSRQRSPSEARYLRTLAAVLAPEPKERPL